jgi:hypothetical protein
MNLICSCFSSASLLTISRDCDLSRLSFVTNNPAQTAQRPEPQENLKESKNLSGSSPVSGLMTLNKKKIAGGSPAQT